MLTNNYRCITIPGSGIVARWPDEILLCVGPTEVLDNLMRRAKAESLAPRVMAESIDWLSNGGGYVSLRDSSAGLVVEGDGFCDAVIDGNRLPVADAAAVDGSVTYLLDRRTATPSSEQPLDHYLNLSHGIVRGSGLILTPHMSPVGRQDDGAAEVAQADGLRPETSSVDPSAAIPSAIDPPASTPSPQPPDPIAPSPAPAGTGETSIKPIKLDEEVQRDPLPIGAESTPVADGRAIVRGRACPVDHVNHPEAQFCASCGRALNATHKLIEGPRPSLGSILFDDGSRHDLVFPAQIGRDPSGAEGYEVIVVESDDISRQHLTIDLKDWDVLVVDDSSANKTFAREYDRDEWRALTPGVPHPIQPGTLIRLGQERYFTFQATHALPPPTR